MDNVTLGGGNWVTSHTGKEFYSIIGNGDSLYNWVTNTTCSSFTFCQNDTFASFLSLPTFIQILDATYTTMALLLFLLNKIHCLKLKYLTN